MSSIKNFSEFSSISEDDIKFLLDKEYIISVYPIDIRTNELEKILYFLIFSFLF